LYFHGVIIKIDGGFVFVVENDVGFCCHGGLAPFGLPPASAGGVVVID
jgi:hypothetical protein